MKTTENEVTAVYEPVRLAYKPKITEKISCTSSEAAFNYLKNVFAENISYREMFVCLLLNRANRAIGHVVTSLGGKHGTVADVGIILQHMLLANASGVILAHNHPSGNMQPSEQDKKMTFNIEKATEYFDLKVLDHLILTESGYFSFADEGLLF